MIRTMTRIRPRSRSPALGRRRSRADRRAPRLKELVTVTAEIVRIGDLVENAGAVADVPVFRAPDLGQTGAVQVARIAEALRPDDYRPRHRRSDRSGGDAAVARADRQGHHRPRSRALSPEQYGLGDAQNLAVILDRGVRILHVEPTRVGDLAVARMNVDPRSGRFDIAFELPGSTLARRASLRFTGTVTETAEAATLTRSLRPGDVIKASDVIARAPAQDRAARRRRRSRDQASAWPPGLALRSGQALRMDDLVKPQIVQRNDPSPSPIRCPASCCPCAARRPKPARSATSSACSTSSRTAPFRPPSSDRAASASPGRPDRRRSRLPSCAASATEDTDSSPAPSERPDHAFASIVASSSVPPSPRRRLGCCRSRPPGQCRRAARAVLDREPDHAARLQAGAHADADAATGLLQPELAVAERLARLLQGSARPSGRRHPHRHGQSQRQGRVANETQRSRENKEDSGVDDFFGKQEAADHELAAADAASSPPIPASSSDGKGSVNRSEALVTNVAAVVTQVLPNGNLVVEGKQEIRVNFEVRELIVAGIVRPEDIQGDNTIDSSKIAEGRIAYGGRGQITDVQQPRYGQQVLDVLLPF